MSALDQFVKWISGYTFVDRNKKLPAGLLLQYHSRSDEHSKKLAELIVEDLLDACEVLRQQAERGEVAYSINYPYHWENGKSKTIDLALGIPSMLIPPPEGTRIRRLHYGRNKSSDSIRQLLIACEEKAVMTEHGKSQPRIYSELNDSHQIVNGGNRHTIATGITMVNIATTFISPLRQSPDRAVVISHHNQPHVAESMIKHLRQLPMREGVDGNGFDAYCTFVVDMDNQGHVALCNEPPAPQPGDTDHYSTFLARIARFYTERFGDLSAVPEDEVVSVEAALTELASRYPELFSKIIEFATTNGLDGAAELQAILSYVERQAASDH